MTASERFRKYLSGEPVDRCPAIEWAPWWHLTVNRWRGEGLPAEAKRTEDIQDYFGLDKCIQTHGVYRTAATPPKPGEGLGIMEDEEDWEKIRKTLFPPVETVISEDRFNYLQMTHDRGDTLNFFTVEGFFTVNKKSLGQLYPNSHPRPITLIAIFLQLTQIIQHSNQIIPRTIFIYSRR